MANPFFDTPRSRRLKRDLLEMKALAKESSIFTFQAKGDAPESYTIHFDGLGIERADEGMKVRNSHEVSINLPVSYPMTMPQIKWETPIAHPNISSGNPCFGTFSMNPNVRLVEIVEILWDMARMASYNPYGGYGEKDMWQVLRKDLDFPVDKRILRDKVSPTERPTQESGDFDLIIMEGARGGRLGSTVLDPRAVKVEVEKYLKKNKLSHESHVYTQEEWRERGEEYGNDAVATIATEGPLYDLLNNGDWPGASSEIRSFEEFLTGLGLWYELGYAWSAHLYPLET